MTFTANFEGTPLSTGRSESLLIIQNVQAASLDSLYKREVKVASSLKEHMAVFPTQRKQRSWRGGTGGDTGIWISCKNSSKHTKSFFFLDILLWRESYLDRDSLMCCLGIILTKSKLDKTGPSQAMKRALHIYPKYLGKTGIPNEIQMLKN